MKKQNVGGILIKMKQKPWKKKKKGRLKLKNKKNTHCNSPTKDGDSYKGNL